MKQFRNSYTAHGNSTNETFADLLFCALVILVLFILALAIEVSERVRSKESSVDLGAALEKLRIAENELSIAREKTQQISVDADSLRDQVSDLKASVSNLKHSHLLEIQVLTEQRVGLEQRFIDLESQFKAESASKAASQLTFTGAREECFLHLIFDYKRNLFFFAPSSLIADITTSEISLSSQSNLTRQSDALKAAVDRLKAQRGYSPQQMASIIGEFSNYLTINHSGDSNEISDGRVRLRFFYGLCVLAAGDSSDIDDVEALIDSAFRAVADVPRPTATSILPHVTIRVDTDARRLYLGDVGFAAEEAKDILVSIGGRGAKVSFTGISSGAPAWLRSEVLIPAGFIEGIDLSDVKNRRN